MLFEKASSFGPFLFLKKKTIIKKKKQLVLIFSRTITVTWQLKQHGTTTTLLSHNTTKLAKLSTHMID